MSKRYFGTDGIRGVAGEPPLDAATVYAIGLALGDDLQGGTVVLGEDTRESSPAIAAQLAAGLSARGVEVAHAGVLPTPGVAFLAATGKFRAGVMISASHNPWQDNGIKIFGASGYKLPDEEEAAIEAAIEKYRPLPAAAPERLRTSPELRAAYATSLAERFRDTNFRGLRFVIDCGNGAASSVVGELCARLNIRAEIIAATPDGRNINAGVGALHPQAMTEQVRQSGADAGVALDGDADRAILADAQGGQIDGDCVLWMMAHELHLPHVVGTVMTNLGLELALRRDGIALERTQVGDKYVLERMQQRGVALGGEPSGHVIFANEATTGDGLRTALHCFALMARKRQPLRALCAGWQALPQKIVNVRVDRKQPLEELRGTQAAIHTAEREFNGAGRVLVRYSGTEMLARVMVEAADGGLVERHAQAIALALQHDLRDRNAVSG
ncbi:MAG: phosphoglucosamine mutase [Acidobacteria bacterium]|nr:MAG: phosphoglucosamine mutase [Acidobacteriota bacterium]